MKSKCRTSKRTLDSGGTTIDPRLVGFWRVRTIDMVENRTVSLAGGLPDEVVEFSAGGHYVIWHDPRRPMEFECRCHETDPPGVDVWIEGMESLTCEGIYDVTDDVLVWCMAGDSRPRPTEIRRDDALRWCVKTLDRCDGLPYRGRTRR